MRAKILVADDSEVMRRAICRFLAGQSQVNLVGQSSKFQEAMRMVRELQPDVVVMDLRMAEHAHCETQKLKAELTSLRLVAISASSDSETKTLSDRLGADKFIDKMHLYDKLVPTILELLARDSRSEETQIPVCNVVA
jgi:two-component system, NarL family, invasion response regulator UvrY